MRAVEFVDGTVTIAEIADPIPEATELLVRVEGCGINGADILQAGGNYPPPVGAPVTPGLELAGVVEEVGSSCRRFGVGDRVMAVVPGGAQAERCAFDESLAMPVPDVLDGPMAGGFPEVFETAFDALFTQGGLTMGDRVCIHGAAGGVGTAATQLAVAAGATVTATVRNSEIRSKVAALGATVLDPANFVDAGPFDLILELVGAPNWPANIHALSIEGRICIIGVGAGSKVEVNLVHLMGKRAKLFASTLRARPLAQRAQVARRVEHHVLPLVDAGRITVPVADTFVLADAAAGYDRFRAGNKFGKVIIVP
ncbi:MAG: alcohol dehydrogenase catalytic domain-containing protein [Acidimicrobiales bacterium]|nr:alcohol dehydrogenase catalytic domain-containing protein [Acidimicrobiales bacterium]